MDDLTAAKAIINETPFIRMTPEARTRFEEERQGYVRPPEDRDFPEFHEGYDAYRGTLEEGDGKYRNPYDANTQYEEHRLFAEGWYAGKYDP